MQEVSQKWKDLHNTGNENYILPQTDVSISFNDVDTDIKGYTDTTYTTSALGDVNVAFSSSQETYNIYFKTPVNVFRERLFAEWLYPEYSGVPYSVVINFYDIDNNLLSTETFATELATSINFELTEENDVSYISLVLSNPQAVLGGIATINIEKKVVLSSNDLISCELSQSGDLLSFELPKAEFNFELDNIDGRYNPENPNNKLKSLSKKDLVKVQITQHYNDGTSETINGGEFFISEWNVPQNGITASFTARDGIAFMDGKFYLPQTGIIGNHYRACNSITSNGKGVSGNTDYVDTGIVLENNHEYRINMCVSFADTSGNNVILGSVDGTKQMWFGCHNGKFFITLGTNCALTLNTTIILNKKYNVYVYFLTTTSGTQLMGMEISDATGVIERQNIRFNNLGTRLYPSHSLYLFSYNAGSSVGYKSNATIYTERENPSEGLLPFPFTIFDSEYNVSNYEFTDIGYIFEGTPCIDATDNTNIGIYNAINNAFLLAIGNNISIGNYIVVSLFDIVQQAFSSATTGGGLPLNEDGSNRYSQYSLINELKNYTIDAEIEDYDHSIAETIQLCCNAAKCIWYFDRNGQSHIEPFDISTTRETIDYNITTFNSFQNAEITLTDELASVNVNDGLGIYTIVEKGTVQTVDNPFITTRQHANSVAKWVAEILSLRKSLSGDFRPDTRADVFDMATVTNKYSTDDIYFTSLKYVFNGAFKGSYEGKVFNSQYNNSIDNE